MTTEEKILPSHLVCGYQWWRKYWISVLK